MQAEQRWELVDEFITDHAVQPAPVLEAVLAAGEAAGLPAIQVSPPLGKLLALLVRIGGARRVLEIGTLGAYSTVWMARALPADGRLDTIELDPDHAEVARANLRLAEVDDRVTVHVGPALEHLPRFADDGHGPIDFVFIDADKLNNPAYLDHACALTRPGGVIVVDNGVRGGRILDADSGDVSIRGTRLVYERLRDEPRLDATAIQTVGAKGYDGFILAVKTTDLSG